MLGEQIGSATSPASIYPAPGLAASEHTLTARYGRHESFRTRGGWTVEA